MNYEEQTEAADKLLAFVGTRWFVLVILSFLVFGIASNATISDAETLRRVGIIFIVGLIATLIEWGLVHGEGMRTTGGLRFVQGLHIALLLFFIFLLLWFGGVEQPWAALLFLLPIIEATLILGVFGVIIAGIFSLISAWSVVAMTTVGTSVITSEGVDISAFFLQRTLDSFFPHALLFLIVILLSGVGSYAWHQEEYRLRRSRKSAYSLLVELDEGVVVYDERYTVRYVNPAAERLLGVQRRDIIGHQAGRYATIAAPGSANLSKILFTNIGDQGAHTVELQDPDKSVIVIQRSLFSPEGEPLGMVRLIRDVTDQQRVGKLKSEFISVAAHQLRTPLSGVRWAMEELKDDPALKGGQRAAVLQAAEAVNRTIMLVNELLDVARIEEGRFDYEFSMGQLEDMVGEVIRELTAKAKEKGVVLEFTPPSNPLPPLRMDKEKLRMVVESLIDNAVNYTPADGHVVVEVSVDGSDIVLKVEDTGVGIPKDQQDQIFTKFFRGDNVVRLQTEGSGLGLFIARNIVERHDGRIWFESQKGTGTRFYASIPLSSNSASTSGGQG